MAGGRNAVPEDDVTSADRIWQMRRELGRELAARRKAAHLSQAELARLTGKSRSAISTLESSLGSAMGRTFWQRCDEVLGTREMFTRRWDRIHHEVDAARAAVATARRQESGRALGGSDRTPLQALRDLPAGPGGLSAARDLYRHLGWPLAPGGAELELATGMVADALEVAAPAGLLAIQWWRDSGGAADVVRGLPALPRPGQALAVIASGQRRYFLVRPGRSPWPNPLPVPTAPKPMGQSVIRWHSAGGRVPLPPGHTGEGERAEWEHLPPRAMRLPSPFALLGLLAKAATVVKDGNDALSLTGGVLVMAAVSR